MADLMQRMALHYAHSMEVYADGESTFVYGHWREWLAACDAEGRTIPPSEFKARKIASNIDHGQSLNPSQE